MIYYANPCTEAIRDAMLRGQLGCIITPHQGNVSFPDEVDTIADNGCFSGRWTEQHWMTWLLDQPRTLRFAVAPDVFTPGKACHDETLERWRRYGPLIERHGFRAAFVAQIGATPQTIPTTCYAIFLGGSTEWKEGYEARSITEAALSRGQWVHMGRVNSLRRYELARSFGCNSVDGTYLTFGPDTNLRRLLRWTEEAQLTLWEAAA